MDFSPNQSAIQLHGLGTSLLEAVSSLWKQDKFSDVTLACQGKIFQVHKLILSSYSDYFNEILENISSISPTIVLTNIKSEVLESILQYLYLGEVSILKDHLTDFIKTANLLSIKGIESVCECMHSLFVEDKKEENIKRSAEIDQTSTKRAKLSLSEESCENIDPQCDCKNVSVTTQTEKYESKYRKNSDATFVEKVSVETQTIQRFDAGRNACDFSKLDKKRMFSSASNEKTNRLLPNNFSTAVKPLLTNDLKGVSEKDIQNMEDTLISEIMNHMNLKKNLGRKPYNHVTFLNIGKELLKRYPYYNADYLLKNPSHKQENENSSPSQPLKED